MLEVTNLNAIKSLVWILFTVGLAVITQNISKNVIFSIVVIGVGSLIVSLMTKSVNSFFYCFYLSFSAFNVINYIFLNPQNAYKISHLNGTLVDFVMVIIFGIFQITYMVLEYVYTNKKIITTTNIKWSICAVCIFVLILFFI